MQFRQDHCDFDYIIKAYEPGKITVNEQTYQSSLIIAKDTLVTDWAPQCLADLTHDHLQCLIDMQPDVLLLGTGEHFLMPKPAKLAPLYSANIGVECMSSDAACRTFIALAAEGRRVVAAILIG